MFDLQLMRDRFSIARQAERTERQRRYRELKAFADECPLWPQYRSEWVKAKIRKRLGTYPPASRLPA